MTASALVLPFNSAFASSGASAPNSQLFAFLANTSTPTTLYLDAQVTDPAPNPVIADAAGRFPVLYSDGAQSIRVEVRDAIGGLLFEVDDFLVRDGETIISSIEDLRTYKGGGPILLADGSTWITDGTDGHSAEEDDGLTSIVNVSTGVLWKPVDGRAAEGVFQLGNLALSSGQPLRGQGRETEIQRNDGSGSFILATGEDNLSISDLNLNMRFTENGEAGHGLALADCSDVIIDNVRIFNHGNNGGSAGSGALVFATDPLNPVEFVRISNTRAEASTATSTDTNGILIADARHAFMYANYASGQKSFAHELKQNSQYCAGGMLIAKGSEFGLGFGQTTVGDDGCDFNAFSIIVTEACDQGVIVGEGDYNIFSTQVSDSTGAAGGLGATYAVHFSTDTTGNVHLGALAFGANMSFPVRMRGDDNYAAIADHSGALDVATFDAGAAGNVVQVLHPGAGRTSVLNRINDIDDANTVWSGATGEFYRPKSGRVHVRTGVSGATPTVNHKLVAESDGNCFVAALAGAGREGGLQIGVGASANRATLLYNDVSGYWTLAGFGGGISYRFASTYLRANTDDTASLGLAANRFTEVFATNGTISTSDARFKTPLRDFSEAETAAASDCAKLIGVWQWLSAVEEKGDKARLHLGPTVQDVIAVMEKHGLKPMNYSFICYDEWDDEFEEQEVTVYRKNGKPKYLITERQVPRVDRYGEPKRDDNGDIIMKTVKDKTPITKKVATQIRVAGNRYSLRKDEFAMFVMRGQEARITALEATR